MSSAETTGGGVPGHVLRLPSEWIRLILWRDSSICSSLDENTWLTYNGELRSNATLFHDAWQDYVSSNMLSNLHQV